MTTKTKKCSLRMADGGEAVTRWAGHQMSLRMADGGGVPATSLRGMYQGVQRLFTPAPATQLTPAAPAPAAPAPAPVASAPTRGISGYVANGALARREAAAGLQDGGQVPGSGTGDKIPAKYEPGEFVVSNDMIDDNPGLREQLHGMRAQTLAARGKDPAAVDARQWRGGVLKAEDGEEGMFNRRALGAPPAVEPVVEVARPVAPAPTSVPTAIAEGNAAGQTFRAEQAAATARMAPKPGGGMDPGFWKSLPSLDLNGYDGGSTPGGPNVQSADAGVQGRPGQPAAVDGLGGKGRVLSGDRLPPLQQVDSAPRLTNPNVGPGGSAEARAFRAGGAPVVAPVAEPAPVARVSMRAGVGAQPSAIGKAAYAGGRVLGGATKLLRALGPAAAGADVVSHFNDFKINDPGVDSSAGGTWNALKAGEFAKAGRSLSKGALETGMDLGSAVANTLDLVVPGKAPVSTAYDNMMRDKFSDKAAGAFAAQDQFMAHPVAEPPPAPAASAPQGPGGPTPPTASGAGGPGDDPSRPSNITRRGNSYEGSNISGTPTVNGASMRGAYSDMGEPGVSSADRVAQIERDTEHMKDVARMRAQLGDGANPMAGATGLIGKGGYGDRRSPEQLARDAEVSASSITAPGGKFSQGGRHADHVLGMQSAERIATLNNASHLAATRMSADNSIITTGMNNATMREGNRLNNETAERDNIRTNSTSLAGHKMTNAYNLGKLRLEQGNKDREYEHGVANDNFTQQAAAQKNITDHIASILPPGADGKPDTATAARYMAGLTSAVGQRMDLLKKHLAINPGDKTAAGELQGLSERGVAQLGPQAIRKYVEGMQLAELASATATNAFTPWGTRAVVSSAPITKLRRLANGDYQTDRGTKDNPEIIPGRYVDKVGGFMGIGGQTNRSFESLKE